MDRECIWPKITQIISLLRTTSKAFYLFLPMSTGQQLMFAPLPISSPIHFRLLVEFFLFFFSFF